MADRGVERARISAPVPRVGSLCGGGVTSWANWGSTLLAVSVSGLGLHGSWSPWPGLDREVEKGLAEHQGESGLDKIRLNRLQSGRNG
ncbi:hypothetical protein SAMN00790413_04151 [Deinococcus hopiensis KR-140]|uniref:Uncharacterized protein n=1 Tax=Deinococcus hopiensis KR-140 TaxID=695939 RepID=A0A1W1UP49_9DEIO|nr:hypothetical protein SAMN00790413_04151 [Deinococcus hopiensis KR-140]